MSSSHNQDQEGHRSDLSATSELPANREYSTYQADVPELSTLLPAIFVPVDKDFLEPIEPAKDRVELLQRMQLSLDVNEKAVRANLVWMMEREARRRLNQAKRNGLLDTPREPKAIAWNEGEKLLATIAYRADPKQAYHLPSTILEEFKTYPSDTALAHLSPLEWVTHDILTVVHNGSSDIEGYSKRHIEDIRDRLNASLGKEKQDDDDSMFVS